jgi:zinc/manganese transport system substrate-binding protein
MKHLPTPTLLAATAALALIASGCGAAEDDTAPADAAAEDDTAPADAAAEDDVEPVAIVATTSILGDVVTELVGDAGEVTVLMGPGVDPHGYEPSARDAAMLREADLVVANGLQLEENLISTLEAAEADGVEVFELAPPLDPIEFDFDGDHGHSQGDDDDGHDDDHGHDDEDDHGHDDEDDHGHDDEDDHGHGDEDDHGHGDEDDHDHGPEDPHVWFDPVRMAEGVELLATELSSVAPQLDADALGERATAYGDELLAIDDELTAAFEEVPEADRIMVTNHDALGYLADRYDLDVVGTVIPGSSTQVEADAREFAELVATVEEYDITTVFAENTDSTVLAEQLASEVVGRGDLEVEVVQVATDALGEPGTPTDTYLGLLRETGTTIAESLAG